MMLPTNGVRTLSELRFILRLEETSGPHKGPPHVGDGTVVEAQTFIGLAEVAAQDAFEVFQVDLDVRIERVQVIDADQPTRHVPPMLERVLVRLFDVRL